MVELPPITLEPYIKFDNLGNATITFNFPNQPVLIFGGDEDLVYYQPFTCPLEVPYQIDWVRRFIATDRGDIGEFDINLFSKHGLQVFSESLHKEQSTAYEAWRVQAVSFKTSKLTGNLVGRVTAENELLPDDAIVKYRQGKRLSARAHYGVVFGGKVAP